MTAFAVISRYGDFNGGAWRLFQEGHDVRIFYPKGKVNDHYDGMVPEAKTLKEALDGAEIVVMDMTGMEEMAEDIKAAGYPVIGSGLGYDEEADDYIGELMEHNRVYALELMQKVGIKIPDTYVFNAPAEALAFVLGAGGGERWVAKPIEEAECDMTIVAKDNEQLAAKLQEWIDEPKTKGTKLVLQKFVEGIEVNPEIWFSNGEPVLPATLLFETKKFMNDDKGKTVGCGASTVIPYYGTRLIEKTLKKLYPFIKKTGYTGPADCSVIIDKKGDCYFLESGWRFGYSAIYAEMALLDIPFGEFLTKLVAGTLKKVPWKKGFGGSLRITQNPYPYTNEDWKFQQKVYECIRGTIIPDAPFVKDLDAFPMEVYQEDGEFKIMGNYGIACEMAGFGKTLKELWENIEKKCEAFQLPDAEYRTQNAGDVEKRIKDFGRLGW